METMRRSHLYEQLPSTHYESGEYEYPIGVNSSLSTRLSPLDALSLSEDGSSASGVASRSAKPNLLSHQLSGQSLSYQSPAAYRRRENPLYQSISRIDAKSPDSRYRCDCCFTVSLVLTSIACLVSFVSIGISLHMSRALSAVTINQTYVDGLEAQMKFVVLKYDLLAKQMDEMKYSENQSLKNFDHLTDQSLVIKNEIYQRFNNLRADVDQQISNISKMPGPPGPPGLANMASCNYSYSFGAGPSARPNTTTLWLPENILVAAKYIITGVECSTDSGLAAFLSTTTALGFTQYRCHCFGSDNQGLMSRKCFIHYWSCPVTN